MEFEKANHIFFNEITIILKKISASLEIIAEDFKPRIELVERSEVSKEAVMKKFDELIKKFGDEENV